MKTLARKTVQSRRRIGVRKTWSAELATVGGHRVMTPRRGAWSCTIDKQGNVVEDARDDHATLRINVGDRLFLFGPAVEQISMAVVVGVMPDGESYRLTTTTHCIAAAPDGDVLVMRRSR